VIDNGQVETLCKMRRTDFELTIWEKRILESRLLKV
jgi:hypothetical protein